MKNKISFAFVLFCVVTLLSVSSILGIVPGLIGQITSLNIVGLAKYIVNAACTLIAPAIVLFLYLNRKQDCKSKFALVLMIAGILTLVQVALSVVQYVDPTYGMAFDSSQPFILEIVKYGGTFINLLLGILLICVSQSIKKEKVLNFVKVLAFLIGFLGVFFVISNLMIKELIMVPSIQSSVSTICMALGLGYLSKTVYDYEQCFFFNKAAVMVVAGIAVVIVFVMIVAGGEIGNGGGNASCGHVSCKNNGPFHCMGKGNTCKNMTNCAYDLYCDDCD